MIRRDNLKYGLAVTWLVVTVSLAAWWLVFGLSQARELGDTAGVASRASQVQRMLLWEGGVFIALLVGGGTALLVAIRSERDRRRQVQDFFTAFTHDLKTALASLRLQAESLQEDLAGGPATRSLERLAKDTVRLELQLDNSLHFAQPDAKLQSETVDISGLAARAALDWPDLGVSIQPGLCARADERALLGVIRNLLQNAAVHGRARRVEITGERRAGRMAVRIHDDGGGAPPGIARALAAPFERISDTSGTAVGLYISQRLLSRMDGHLIIAPDVAAGFAITIELREAAC